MNLWSARMLRSALVALTMLSLTLLSGCGNNAGDPATHLARAQTAFDAGRLQEALIETKNALKGAPDEPEARFLMARLYLLGDEPEAAIVELQRAENNGLATPRLLAYRAQALFDSGAFDPLLALAVPEAGTEGIDDTQRALIIALQGYAQLAKRNAEAARTAFETALQISPNTEMALLGQVRLALAERRLDEAWSLVNSAAETLPESPDVQSLLGDIALLKKDVAAAQGAYMRAVELAPKRIEPRAKLATLLLGTGASAEAEPHLAALEALAPEDPRTLYSRGLMLYQGQNYESAVTKLEAALAARPSDQRTMLLLGGAHLGLGNYEQSLEQLETLLALRPGSVDAGLMAAQALLAQGENARAADTIDGVLLRNPREPRLLALKSRVELMRGNPGEAVRWLAALREAEPETPGLDLSLGLGLLRAGRPNEAVEALERALERNPDADRVQIAYAEALYESGQTDAAVDYARGLLDAAPGDRARITLLGKLLVAEQSTDEARALYEAGLKANPGDPAIGHNLAVLALQDGQPELAVSRYEAVLTQNTQDIGTLVRLGLLEFKMNALKDAERHLRKALALDPAQIPARVTLSKIISVEESPQFAEQLMNETPRPLRGDPAILAEQARLHTLMNRPLATIETLILLTRAEPENGAVWLQLAQVQEREGNRTEAATAYENAARYRLEDPRFGSLVVRGLYRSGRSEAAHNLANELSDATPTNADLGLLRGWLAEQDGDLGEAVTIYADLLERTEARSAMLALVNAISAQGKTADALAQLDRWEAAHGRDTVTTIARAQMHVDAREDVKALALIESLLANNPDNAGLLNDAAQLLMDVDPAKALDYARRANQLLPDNPIIEDTLAGVLATDGQWEESLLLFAKAVDGAPDNLEIRLNLARTLLASGAREQGLTELERVLARADRGPLYDEAKALQSRFRASL